MTLSSGIYATGIRWNLASAGGFHWRTSARQWMPPSASSAGCYLRAYLSSWLIKAPMLTPRNISSSGVIGDVIYTFGDQGNHASGTNGTFNQSEVYEAATDMWITLVAMLHPRHSTSGVAVNGAVYIPDGADMPGVAPLTIDDAFFP